MANSNEKILNLVGIALAGAIAVAATEGKFDFLDCAVGVTLLMVLFAYTEKPAKTIPSQLAFSSVVGLCLLLVFGVAIDHFALMRSLNADGKAISIFQGTSLYSALGWLILTGITFLVVHVMIRKH